MTVLRRWILPIVWVVIFAVIAAALVKLAFFDDPAASAGSDGVVPTGELSEPQIPAWRDTIRNDLELAATVSSDPAVDVKVQKPGTVVDVFFAVGAPVTKGAVIASVREETVNEEGTTYGLWSEIVAPADGVLSAFTVLGGQPVAVGDTVGAVAPSTFRVQGSISPVDRYRLISEPTEAEVTIAGGPAPFTCDGLVLETPLAGSETAPGEDTTEVTTTVRCAVPPDVRVFPGLSATMTIAGGIAEDVVVVPMTAVLGAAESGVVFVPDETGQPVEREVTLGLNDGVNIEVTGGLEEGESVFEYAPGGEAPAGGTTGEECTEVEPGVTECVAVEG